MEVPKSLSYVDAVRLLSGEDEVLLNRLDSLAGGVLLALVPAVPGVLALFDAKREVARLGHDLVRRFRERRAGLGRYERTQRLAAAHTVIVVAAYFDAMAREELPMAFATLELTRAEQVAIAGQVALAEADLFVNQLLAAGDALPAPHGAHEQYRAELTAYYDRLSGHVERFVSGLAIWDGLSTTQRDACIRALHALPERAVGQYEEHLRSLAADFPEVMVWLTLLEHEATRGEVRRLEPSLVRVERELERLSSGRVPPEQAGSIARAHRAALSRPIAPSGEVPAHVVVPTLERAYLPPQYRITDVNPQSGPSDEAWWEHVEIRDDLEQFLLGYLTSSYAVGALILVLGQPGAGKSVLTCVLAARMPAADFLVVRVPLRDVAGEVDIQRQIEEAITLATGEHIEWTALVRSNSGALPVILIDGFDELLQATGLRQTDYLLRVAEFQRREADQGRPVAIVVTTRTSVADRARTPADTLLIRLEPFDQQRIQAWVDVWNETNAANFERTSTHKLNIDTVMAHADIAGQPLLLLMLALYDADGNALQRMTADLHRTQLYEQLLVSFARREITKHRPGIPDEELVEAVEHEMRRLSIVAFAMFNRASQWVTETDLDQDLTAIFGADTSNATELRTSMRAAERALGRFFFVHRSRARRDTATLHSYEFLHATFGEYLVARLTWQVALDTMRRNMATTLPTSGIDDELMYALLSFTALTARRPTVDFLTAMANTLAADQRAPLGDVLIRLYRVAGFPRTGRAFDSYHPRLLTVSARHASYSANVFLLAVAVLGTVRASELYGSAESDIYEAWRVQTMLWQSQLGYDFHGLLEVVALERLWESDRRDMRLTIDDGTTLPAPVDPLWSYNIAEDRRGILAWSYSSQLAVQRRVNFLCRGHLDQMYFALSPVLEALGPYALSRFYAIFQDTPDIVLSPSRAVLDVWLLATDDRDRPDRHEVYCRCARICTQDDRVWSANDAGPYRLTTLLLRALADDRRATSNTATTVLVHIIRGFQWPLAPIADEIVLCALASLGRDEPAADADRMLRWAVGYLDLELVSQALRRQLDERMVRVGPPLRPPWTVDDLELGGPTDARLRMPSN